MAANDGPVPVRTPAHAARLAARKVGQYGIAVSEPAPDYSRLLTRVRDVVDDVRGEREAATSECYALPRSIILGSTGYLGSHVLRQALAAGHEVTVFVRTPSKLPPEARGRVSVHTGDLSALDLEAGNHVWGT